MSEPPPPKFQRFERIVVVVEPYHYPELRGQSGTILWRDSVWVNKVLPGMASAAGWLYLAYFSPENVYRSFWESWLQSEGVFDQEAAYLGTRPEYSFDIIMEDDHSYVEGTYRLPGKFWEIMIFSKRDVPTLEHRPNEEPVEWGSGITGTIFSVPNEAKLNREYVRDALATAFGCHDWVEVSGPDSMVLR